MFDGLRWGWFTCLHGMFARFLVALDVDRVPLQELVSEPVPVSADDQVVPVPQHLQELAGGLQLRHRGAVLVDDEGPLPLPLGVGLPGAPFEDGWVHDLGVRLGVAMSVGGIRFGLCSVPAGFQSAEDVDDAAGLPAEGVRLPLLDRLDQDEAAVQEFVRLVACARLPDLCDPGVGRLHSPSPPLPGHALLGRPPFNGPEAAEQTSRRAQQLTPRTVSSATGSASATPLGVTTRAPIPGEAR